MSTYTRTTTYEIRVEDFAPDERFLAVRVEAEGYPPDSFLVLREGWEGAVGSVGGKLTYEDALAAIAPGPPVSGDETACSGLRRYRMVTRTWIDAYKRGALTSPIIREQYRLSELGHPDPFRDAEQYDPELVLWVNYHYGVAFRPGADVPISTAVHISLAGFTEAGALREHLETHPWVEVVRNIRARSSAVYFARLPQAEFDEFFRAVRDHELSTGLFWKSVLSQGMLPELDPLGLGAFRRPADDYDDEDL